MVLRIISKTLELAEMLPLKKSKVPSGNLLVYLIRIYIYITNGDSRDFYRYNNYQRFDGYKKFDHFLVIYIGIFSKVAKEI
tara:strand:- start:374 stop:616 length:243 start_codon:yes stop_codon:yes gene_type:complete